MLAFRLMSGGEGTGGANGTFKRSYNSGGYDSLYLSMIDGLKYYNEAAFTSAASLSAIRSDVASNSSGTKGYSSGGYDGANKTTIDGVEFASDAAFLLGVTLSEIKSTSAGCESSLKGYVGGGKNTVNLSTIEGVVFQGESVFTLGVSLSETREQLGSCESGNNGYWGGGHNGTTYSKVVDGILFANESSINLGNTLTTGRYNLAANSSSTKGYWGAGSIGATRQDALDGVIFSNGTGFVATNQLGYGARYVASSESDSNGYFAGGYRGSYSDGIERVVHSTEVVTFISSTLSVERTAASGCSSQVNPISGQPIKTVASDGAVTDELGTAVAVYGEYFIAGAPNANIGANSNQGAAYVYKYDGTGEVKITASDGVASDQLGKAVAISSTKVALGVEWAPNGADSDQGVAYVYDLNGTNELRIDPSDGTSINHFGKSITMSSTKVVIGALNSVASGSIYIYDIDGTNEIKVTASDAGVLQYFGTSVDMTESRIVVGATRAAGNVTQTGAMYLYDIDGTNELKITYSNGASGDSFGQVVAISDTTVVTGSYLFDGNGLTDSGVIFIYDIDGTNEIVVTPSDAAAYAWFGYSVDICGNKIIVGAAQEDAPLSRQGAIYIYDLDGTNEIKVTIDDLGFTANSSDGFGSSVGASSVFYAIGTPSDDDIYTNSGAVYTYFENLCTAVVGGSSGTHTKGYYAGGLSIVYQSSIESLDMINEVAYSESFSLFKAKGMMAGISNFITGYWGGGYDGTVNFDIETITFSDESMGVMATSLSVARYLLTSSNSSTIGYFFTGYINPISYQNTIDGVVFTSDTRFVSTDSINTARIKSATTQSSTQAYTGGGRDDSSNYLNNIEDYIFSSDTVGSVTDTLTGTKTGVTSLSSTTKGFYIGGYGTPTYSNDIDQIVFSTETVTAASATLAVARESIITSKLLDIGYLINGDTSAGSGYDNTIETYDMTGDITSTITAKLFNNPQWPTSVNAS